MILLQPYRGLESDTAKATEDLWAEAAEGGVIGLCAVVIRPGRAYSLVIAGLPCTSPLEAALTRGMILDLIDELSELVSRPPRPFP